MKRGMLAGKSEGFTLIELLVVVMIIAILAATGLPKYFRTVERSKEVEVTALASAINSAEQRYYLQNTASAPKMVNLDVAANCSTGDGDTTCQMKYFQALYAHGTDPAYTLTFTRKDAAGNGNSMLGPTCANYVVTFTGDASGATAPTWSITAGCEWAKPG